MKTVELVTGIKSSILGFGCAPILGSVDPKKASAAINAAIDCGITHFDLARSYGYGQAEQFVGKILGPRRNEVVLASKFGIQANWKARLLTPIKPIFWFINNRRITSRPMQNQKIPNEAKNKSNTLLNRTELTGRTMKESLEQSLKALRTDYLDYFFIHEPVERIMNIDELLNMAGKLKSEGKIRAIGIAYMKNQEEIHQPYLSHFDVLQFNNSYGSANYKKIVEARGNQPNILFSPIRGGSDKMLPSEKLIKLSADFSNSVILCSMLTESHLRGNSALFSV